MMLEPPRRFVDLLKLTDRRPTSLRTLGSSIEWNEINLRQFQTIGSLEPDARHASVSLPLHDDETPPRSKPNLEGVMGPVWWHSGFREAKTLQERERVPSGLQELGERRHITRS